MKGFCYIFFFCLLSTEYCSGQTSKVDSLFSIVKSSKKDTTEVNALNNLFSEYEFTDDVKAADCLNKALQLAKKINYKKGIGNTYIHLGYFFEDKSDYPEALKNYYSSLKVRSEIRDKSGIADSYNNIGLVCSYQGNYPEALKNQLIALKIREGIHDRVGIAASYNNIGLVYYFQENYEQALTYDLMALALKKIIGDQKGIASGYNNIGNVYYIQRKYTEALENYFSSLKINETLGAKKGMSFCYNNIGSVYARQADIEGNPEEREKKSDTALNNFTTSLKIRELIGDKAGMASCYINIGSVFVKKHKYKEAKEYLDKAKEVSSEIGYKEILRDAYGELTVLDSAQSNFKGAYENHKFFILFRDSLDNEESRKKTIQSQMTYDFEKKEAVAFAEHKKELENQTVISEEKSRKQKVVLILVSCFLLLVLVFAGFIFRSLRITRKQKNLIEVQKDLVEKQKKEVEHQKLLVEEHQKEIIDSITYARRIQRSLLPTEAYIEKNLKRLRKS